MTDHDRYLALVYHDRTVPMCATCAHYIQHYVKGDQYRGGYLPTCYGHCSYPRVKQRLPHDLCTHYEKGDEP